MEKLPPLLRDPVTIESWHLVTQEWDMCAMNPCFPTRIICKTLYSIWQLHHFSRDVSHPIILTHRPSGKKVNFTMLQRLRQTPTFMQNIHITCCDLTLNAMHRAFLSAFFLCLHVLISCFYHFPLLILQFLPFTSHKNMSIVLCAHEICQIIRSDSAKSNAPHLLRAPA